MNPLDDPWWVEANLVPEYEFSHIEVPGHTFRAWNSMSPELEFCEMAARVVEALPDNILILETGMGQGYVTRRVIKALRPRQHFIAYEMATEWMMKFHESGFKLPDNVMVAQGTPFLNIDLADFLILDSEMPAPRMDELRHWWETGKPDSLMLIHDTYPYGSQDREIMRAIKRYGIQGWHFPNPRGSFLGVHP